MPVSPAKPRPAVHECAWTYETGRKCRRIAGHGQQFCPGHRRPSARIDVRDEPAFHQEMLAWVDQLIAMDLPAILYAVHCSLAKIEPILLRKASRRSRVAFERATIAVMAGRERLVESLSFFPVDAGGSAAPAVRQPPAPSPEAVALARDSAALAQLAGSIPERLSPQQLHALCDSLLNILKTQ